MAAASVSAVGFLTWTSPVPTGGNIYDDRLAAAVRTAGTPLCRHRVRGTWPGDAARYRLDVAAALTQHPQVLVDSIIACAVPDLIVARLRPVTILVHSLLSTEAGLSDAERRRFEQLEAAALRAADQVVTPSRWAAEDLHRRYRIASATVARPGVDPVPLTSAGDGSRLLALGSVSPTKDQLSLVTALGRLTDLPWSARLVGGAQSHPDYTARVRRAVDLHGLGRRVEVTGPRIGRALQEVWASTDLLVVTSRSETYAMVVVEALAHGIPAVVTAGTGAVEALGEVDGDQPGTTVPVGDATALAAVLRRWLTDPELRCRWRAVARRRRDELESWDQTAATVASLLAVATTGARS